MYERRNLAILLGIALGIGLLAWLVGGRRLELASDPLGVVPSSASAMLVIHVPNVLGSTVFDRLVRARGGDEGVRQIERVCGENPLERLNELVLFASGEGPHELEHVGVIARGRLDVASLGECLARVVEEDGGALRRVEIEGLPGVAGRGRSRAAFVGDDAVIAGEDDTVRAIVKTARGDARALASDPVLSSMYEEIARGKDVVLVAHLPAGFRRALREAVRDAVDRDLEAFASIAALGLGARVRHGLALEATLGMRDETQALDAVRAIEDAIDDAVDDPRFALGGASRVLRRVDVQARESRVRLALELDERRLERLLDLITTLLDEADAPAPARGDRGALPEPTPDEIVRPNE